jgi:type IV secretion system protein VirB4
MSQLPTWLLRQMEVDPKRFLPYAGHVCPDTVLLMDNSVLAMIHLHGLPFELQTMQERLGRRDRINTLLRSLADSDRTLHLHMVRHLGAPEAPQPSAASPFVSGLIHQTFPLQNRISMCYTVVNRTWD